MIRRALLRLVALAALWLATTAGGCNYFAPAVPEPPSGGDFIDPVYTDPDATLETIRAAVEIKGLGNGSSAYAGAFADSAQPSTPEYLQVFWQEEVLRWQNSSGRTAPPWRFALEQNFYTQFVQLRGEPYLMVWTPDDNAEPDDIDDVAGTALIHRHYRVVAEAEDQSTSTVIAIGFADISFLRSPSGEWRIVRWEDRPDPLADPSTNPDEVTLGQRRLNTL